MRVRTFVRKLFASSWAHASRCQPTRLAFYSGCCYVDTVMSLCPRENLTHVRGEALCFGQRYNLFRVIAQNNTIQDTTIRSALERLVPACPVVGFGRPCFVNVVHGAIVESGCVLDADRGGSCRSQGYLFGRFCRQRYVSTNHICGCIKIVTVFVEDETHSDLVRLVGNMHSCRQTSCTCLVLCRRAGRRHGTFAIICPMSLSTTSTTFGFLPSVLSVVVDGPLMTDVTVEQDYLPLPLPFALRLPFPLSFPTEK